MKAQKSTFAILFVAQKGKLKASGKAPIFARLTVNKTMVHISTHCDIEPDRWNSKAGRTLDQTREEKRINGILDNMALMLRDKYNEILLRGEDVTASRIKNSLLRVDDRKVMLLEHFDDFNEDYKALIDKGTTHKSWTRYVLTRKKLSNFMQAKYNINDTPLSEITNKFVKDFFIWLRTTEDNSHNYHVKAVHRFRTVFNVARNNGWVNFDPFAGFDMKMEETDRGYLTMRELQTIINKKMPSERLEKIRDIFVFSCYTGLSYIDVKKLKKSEVLLGDDENMWVKTKRGKTGIKVDIRMLQTALDMVKKHRNTGGGDLMFDIPSNQKVNDYLKEIAAICGIEKRVTFHTARHSFLSFAL